MKTIELPLTKGEIKVDFTDRYLEVAVLHAATIMRLITKSTGIMSAMLFPSQSIVRKNPFPAAAINPVGPFQLSTHPATGSFIDDNTGSNASR